MKRKSRAEKLHPNEATLNPVVPVLYDPQQAPWSEISEDILGIESANFGDQAFDEESLEDAMTFPGSTAVLLRSDRGSGRVVGYTYAVPADLVYEANQEILDTGRVSRPNTAYIVNTGIHPDFQKQHLLGPMMSLLESALMKRGFTHVERDSSVNHNFADNIARHYGEQVEESHLHDSEYGQQMYFRIRLTR